jgi:hypothetical protein
LSFNTQTDSVVPTVSEFQRGLSRLFTVGQSENGSPVQKPPADQNATQG